MGPGPYATMLLADFGARVIKVEDAEHGDPTRQDYRINGTGAGHLIFNRNKESIGVNLKDPAGREIFLKLAETADVILESFRPGVMDRLGIGYERIRSVKPDIVYCAISGYGQDGPYRLRPGHDLNYISLAGVQGIIGKPDGSPVIPGVQIADASAGMLAALGVLLALRVKEQTGEGQFVDISLMDAAIQCLFDPLTKFVASGKSPLPGVERLSGGMPAYNIYRTRDGRSISLGILEPHFWANLCRLVDREDLLDFPFVDGEEGSRVTAELAAIFANHTLEEWKVKLEETDICWAPVNTFEEVVSDPQVRHRGILSEESHPLAGKMIQLGTPIGLSVTPGGVRKPAPAHGEQTLDILASLGYSEQAARELRTRKVIFF